MSVHAENVPVQRKSAAGAAPGPAVVAAGAPGSKSYAEVAAAGAGKSTVSSRSSSRRSSFNAQQLMPSKQQMKFAAPLAVALLLTMLLLWVKSSGWLSPAVPPPTRTERLLHKADSALHSAGGDMYDSLKVKAADLSERAAALSDSLLQSDHVQAAVDKATQAREKAAELANRAGVKVEGLGEIASDKAQRAALHGSGVGETIRHTVNQATEAARHAAAQAQEELRHRTANAANSAQHTMHDVKESVHNIKRKVGV